MQECEFTGCVDKVQGKASAGGEKHGNHGLFKTSRKNFRPATLTLCAASCTMNWVRALSSAVRAFGLHPKGRPFKSDSAHQICQQLTSRELQVIKPIVRVLSAFSPRCFSSPRPVPRAATDTRAPGLIEYNPNFGRG